VDIYCILHNETPVTLAWKSDGNIRKQTTEWRDFIYKTKHHCYKANRSTDMKLPGVRKYYSHRIPLNIYHQSL